ncbi:hypothetical protein XENOCAPTIV_001829 [Xenoophorus captivus]|uniref:Uncharacterized protein n=1 Tax=Xenoophorus captivus TaxID=1517983 RepID=A0ABV0S9S7_9TELE
MPEHLMQKIKTFPRRQHYYAYELIKTDGFKIESIMARPTESNILPPPPVTQQNLTLPSVKCSCFVIICEVTPKTPFIKPFISCNAINNFVTYSLEKKDL